jgi:protein ImuB
MGWHELGDNMAECLRSLGLRACVAFGKNPDVARLAAREADPVSVVRDTGAFLHPLPLDVLSPPPEVAEILEGWGVRTVGEFLALPAQEMVERLGPEARTMWQVAAGRTRRPLRLIRPPEVFEESCDLGYSVETTEPLLFLLRRFVDRLAGRLSDSYRVADRMMLLLPLDDRTAYERSFSIPEPTAVADVMFRILATHLETLTLEEKPVGASLTIEPAAPSRQQFGLFGAALRDPNRFGETLARIGAIVGSDAVGFVEPADTHRPDEFRLIERVSWSLEEGVPSIREPVPIGLPLRRFRPPVAARVAVAGRCPSRISSTLVSGRIASVLGPYRLSGHWWEPGAWQLEEWDIALAGGGLYRIAKSAGAWRIEGVYDAVC